jgi:hypothetical protein
MTRQLLGTDLFRRQEKTPELANAKKAHSISHTNLNVRI